MDKIQYLGILPQRVEEEELADILQRMLEGTKAVPLEGALVDHTQL
jgi:hypothetical protein